MTPEYAVEVLSPPVVNVAAPRVTFPTPASDPIVWLNPPMLTTAPVFRVTALAADRTLAAPRASVPEATVVGPVFVLAPLSVTCWVPGLTVSGPLPEMAPRIVIGAPPVL